MEEAITFRSESYKLEGLLDQSSGENAAIITHPHPLYGGDMHNNVVESVQQVYRDKAFTTLRFNFRGTGRSQGTHSNGPGEQNDVCAAVEFIAGLGMKSISLVGYSFGAWINALAAREDIPVKFQVMVSPPVGFIDFKGINTIQGLRLVVAGSRDDIAPPELIQKMMTIWNPEATFKIINGADHFYGGHTKALEAVLSTNLQ
jgi:alpha/beta superfamily hydrolase